MPHHEAIVEIRRIDLDEAKRLFDARQAVFVDVREAARYAEAHVSGAVSLPLREIPRRYTELPSDKQLVFY